ncbi:rhodanese-like domain-containing protein [Neisseriaceae bacterium B1]
MPIQSLTPQQTVEFLQQHPNAVLLDVREEGEVQICAISGSLHIPMNLIAIRQTELPDDAPIVVYCHHGIRSLNVARYLEHVGFDDLYNLTGGIDLWAQQIDKQMASY